MTNINYSESYNVDLVTVDLRDNGKFSQGELANIHESLLLNGLSVVRGFFSKEQLNVFAQEALQCVQPDYEVGESLGMSIASKISSTVNEFSHPFLVSKSAVELVTHPSILSIIEEYIGDKAILHHSLFQQSVPRVTSVIDWHVDTGSNKVLNGPRRFPDKRLRMIVYLSDVSAGGLSYLCGTREAARYFLELPIDTLFPNDELPTIKDRKVTVNERAGTIIFFDAHGLHKPDPPVDQRLVLNVWFARSDFSGSLPPTLVSMTSCPRESFGRTYIFKNARGFIGKIKKKEDANSNTLYYRLVKAINNRWLK